MVEYSTNGIQNGAADGMGLIDPNGNCIELISYEGSFKPTNTACSEFDANDIGVEENGGTEEGQSLQKTGSGNKSSDFTWAEASANTKGQINTDQSFQN